MVSNKIRHISNKIIIPIAKRFENSKITPNIITMFGLLVMALAAIVTAIVGTLRLNELFLIISLLLLGLSGFLDLLDGGVAKFTGQKTTFGGVLDSVIDRYADGIFIIGLIAGNYFALPAHLTTDITIATNWGIILGFIGLVGAYMTSYVRSRAEIEQVEMAGIGLIERAERIAVLAVGLLLEIILPGVGTMFYIFVVLTVLMHFTAFQRVWHAYKELKKADGQNNMGETGTQPVDERESPR
ncbi:hypothetical protein GF325_09900 [Candidatus Bathyarchaeota archaeon]|nr:hypothetical protein [Candidatus Bathyarchaeota archaeon]